MMEFLSLIPKSAQVVIASLALGGAAVFGLESRYVTASQFTKNYVLTLKQEIREVRKLLKDTNLTEHEREMLEEDLAELIDELCYETDNRDRLCATGSK